MKIYLETMGCQMNRLDSELVESALRAGGHELLDEPGEAEVVLYNTCSVRKHAEQKVFSRLGAGGRRNRSGTKVLVGVLGCMAQRLGGKLRRQFPQVDIICAPGQLHRLVDLIDTAAAGGPAEALDPQRNDKPDPLCDAQIDKMDASRDPSVGASRSQAYVRVMRGCDIFCTYCIVPFVRGPQRSRDPDHIAQEVRRLVDAGRSEITLLGQIVNCYRFSRGGTTTRFCDLLLRLSDTPGLRRLRFVTSHPLQFGDDILEAMRDLSNVCEYIHCPAQSGSDAILTRMGRRYTRAQYDELVDRARDIVPGVVLGGDFIVGFGGETEADHTASADLIRRSGYKNSFIFKYSPRPGTAAAKRFADDVPDATKRRRNAELLAVQAEVGLAHHKQYVGRTVDILVTGPSPRADKLPKKPSRDSTQLAGRTRGNHIVVFDGPESLIGQYLDVTIEAATALTLLGRRCVS